MHPVAPMLVLLLAAQTGWRTVVSTECGFVLHVPRGWTVDRVKPEYPRDQGCRVGLRPRDWLDRRARSEYEVAEYAVYVEASEGTLEDGCDKGIVCRDEQGWYVEGRAGTRCEAREFRTPMGRGLRTDVETGVYLKEGGYGGAGEAFLAVVNRGRRMSQFLADHEFDDRKVFDRIVQTFEFR